MPEYGPIFPYFPVSTSLSGISIYLPIYLSKTTKKFKLGDYTNQPETERLLLCNKFYGKTELIFGLTETHA